MYKCAHLDPYIDLPDKSAFCFTVNIHVVSDVTQT